MHSSFIAVFLAVLAPMVALAWHPHGPPPPEFDSWHHPGPEGPRSSATSAIAAGIPTSSITAGIPTSSVPAGIFPSGTYLASGVAGSTGRPINDRLHLHRGANSTEPIRTFGGTAGTATATATASVRLAPYG